MQLVSDFLLGNCVVLGVLVFNLLLDYLRRGGGEVVGLLMEVKKGRETQFNVE